MPMIARKSLFAYLAVVMMVGLVASATILSPGGQIGPRGPARQLQAAGVTSQQVPAAMESLLRTANSLRERAGLDALALDEQLGNIISQWYLLLRDSMGLPEYMQIFGYLNTLSYAFESVPLEFVAEVVERRVREWEEADFESLGYYHVTDGPERVKVFVVLSGGRDVQEVFVTREEIDQLVSAIQAERETQRAADLTETQESIQQELKEEGVTAIQEENEDSSQQGSATHEAPTQETLDQIEQKFEREDEIPPSDPATTSPAVPETAAIDSDEGQVMSGSPFDSRFFRGGSSSNTQTSSSSSFTSTTTSTSGGTTQITQQSSSSSSSSLTRSDSTSNPQTSSSGAPPAPTNLRLAMDDNDLILSWTSISPTRPDQTKIEFTQPSDARRQFTLNLYQSTFEVPFREFWAFRRGPTTVRVSQAFNSSSGPAVFGPAASLDFTAGQHHYDIWKDESGLRQISYRVGLGQSVFLSGRATEGVNNEVILVTPDRQILSYYFDNSRQRPDVILRAGEQLTLSIPVDQFGEYILQVNDQFGEALVNVPLYVGDMYPLLPDFKDLSPRRFSRSALNQPTGLEARRQIVLNLINRIRAEYRVEPVFMDNGLNSLAQDYSRQMIRENFIGHVDLQGRGPGDRARERGITEGIGENIAVNSNLTEGQLMLQRSPVHLRNMVSDRWVRVGLGIEQDQSRGGAYFITQEFSSRDLNQFPLTATQIQGFKQDFLDLIFERYSFIRREDTALSSALQDYQNDSARPNVLTFLRGRGYGNFAVVNVRVSYNAGDFLSLLRPNSLQPPDNSYSSVGITVAYNDGLLQVFAAYA